VDGRERRVALLTSYTSVSDPSSSTFDVCAATGKTGRGRGRGYSHSLDLEHLLVVRWEPLDLWVESEIRTITVPQDLISSMSSFEGFSMKSS
jgi:hypothetical protein